MHRSNAIALACQRRLADGSRGRWLWALASSPLCSGLPALMAAALVVLLWQATSRRTLLPALYGLTLVGGFAFLLLTLDAALTLPLRLATVAVFAFGHRQGQEKAAQDGRRWLDLDR
ncbi:MAG: hypothetical protein VKJ05_04075 [Synechococcaceae cyanobacterium]|nr:hypothetical protein [Synechococcaceae cyanobacterium]